MNDVCPNAEKCPIFTGILQGKDFTTKTYQEKYCIAGDAGRTICKRWQVKQKYGKCPEKVLPNAGGTVDETWKAYSKTTDLN